MPYVAIILNICGCGTGGGGGVLGCGFRRREKHAENYWTRFSVKAPGGGGGGAGPFGGFQKNLVLKR